MSTFKIQDGTWTRRIPVFKNDSWRTLIQKPWITDDRFRQARFVLVDGPTVLVSADDVRRAAGVSKVQSKLMCLFRIDPEKSTINGLPVHLQTET